MHQSDKTLMDAVRSAAVSSTTSVSTSGLLNQALERLTEFELQVVEAERHRKTLADVWAVTTQQRDDERNVSRKLAMTVFAMLVQFQPHVLPDDAGELAAKVQSVADAWMPEEDEDMVTTTMRVLQDALDREVPDQAMAQAQTETELEKAVALVYPDTALTIMRNANLYVKLQGWMSSNVPEGWSKVEELGAVAAWTGHEAMNQYLHDMPECNVGLSAKRASGATPDTAGKATTVSSPIGRVFYTEAQYLILLQRAKEVMTVKRDTKEQWMAEMTELLGDISKVLPA